MPRAPASPGFDPAKLRRLRHQREWTQAELADRIGVPRHYVVRWEGPDRTPTPSHLVALAEALGVQPHELTDNDPENATLKDLRVWAGLTTGELAEDVGVRAGTITRYETGGSTPPEQVMRQLAKLLDVSLEAIQAAVARSR